MSAAGVGVAVLLAAAWAVSAWVSVGYSRADSSGTRSIDLMRGRVLVAWLSVPVPGNDGVRCRAVPFAGWRWWFAERVIATRGVRGADHYVPLWPGALGAGGLALAGRWLERRARASGRGRCGACGYDRAGISPTGPCPECGEVPTA